MVDTNDYQVTTLSTNGPEVTYSVIQKSTGLRKLFFVSKDEGAIDYEYKLALTIRDFERAVRP